MRHYLSLITLQWHVEVKWVSPCGSATDPVWGKLEKKTPSQRMGPPVQVSH